MKIVGHRGVRGLARENTVDAIKKAEALGVDFIEVDARYTRDKQLILHHDRSLYFSCGVNKLVDNLSLAQVKKLADKAGYPIPTLQEMLDSVKKTPLIIEIKELGTADLLFELMNQPQNKRHTWYSTSRCHPEMLRLIELDPKIKVFLTTHLNHPFKVIREAKAAGAYGISVNIWVLSLLTYYMAKRAGLKIMVYVYKPTFLLTWRPLVRAINYFYPHMYIGSDNPTKILDLRR